MVFHVEASEGGSGETSEGSAAMMNHLISGIICVRGSDLAICNRDAFVSFLPLRPLPPPPPTTTTTASDRCSHIHCYSPTAATTTRSAVGRAGGVRLAAAVGVVHNQRYQTTKCMRNKDASWGRRFKASKGRRWRNGRRSLFKFKTDNLNGAGNSTATSFSRMGLMANIT